MTKTDALEKLGKSQIQHGPHSSRIYLMHAHKDDLSGLPDRLDRLAQKKGYGKIFCKVPAEGAEPFLVAGYTIEALIPRFDPSGETVLFLSKFPDPARRDISDEPVQEVLQAALAKRQGPVMFPPPPGVEMRTLTPEDATAAAELYQIVFETYPFPIHDSGYIRETMLSHVVYMGLFEEGRLVALASAETDPKARNAEMTDFATHPDALGKGYASVLLQGIEGVMREVDYPLAYTIARATSFGMNITFARLGYAFSGTLRKNTQISGKLESMNIWHRRLED